MRPIAPILALAFGLSGAPLVPQAALAAPSQAGSTISASLEVDGPSAGIAWSSLALPGAAQFQLGESFKGTAYLAGSLAAGAAMYSLMSSQQEYAPPGSPGFALMVVVGIAGYLGVGSLSAFDALADVAGRWAEAGAVLVPAEGEGPLPVRQEQAPRRPARDE